MHDDNRDIYDDNRVLKHDNRDMNEDNRTCTKTTITETMIHRNLYDDTPRYWSW